MNDWLNDYVLILYLRDFRMDGWMGVLCMCCVCVCMYMYVTTYASKYPNTSSIDP
jgi:hypothetical protein